MSPWGEGSDPDVTRTNIGEFPIVPVGSVLAGRYEILAILGAGGMGTVYRALDQELELVVALKVLRPDLARREDMRQRFRRELITARQVTHRNVVRIYDLGSDGDISFLTMDFVDGVSLDEKLRRDGPFELSEALEIWRQLADALATAHAEDIVHRDLKPANILLDASGRPLITDFGLARFLDSTQVTHSGVLLGTLSYLAPEQAQGQPADHRSDIYALGLIFFETLSGRQPFPGGSIPEIIAQRITSKPMSLSEIGVQAPAFVEPLLERCLEKEPDQRYQTALQILEDLASGVAEGVIPHRVPPPVSMDPPAASPVGSGGGLVGIPSGPPFAAAPSGAGANPPGSFGGPASSRDLTGSSRPRGRPVVALTLVLAVVAVVLAGIFALRAFREPAALEGVPPPVQSVAVLPLANESGQEKLAWTSTGIAEMLSEALAENPNLRVIEFRRTQRTLEDLEISGTSPPRSDLKLLAELLEVGRIVSGRVRAAGERVMIDLRLISLDGEIPAGEALPEERIQAEAATEEELFASINELGLSLAERLGGISRAGDSISDSIFVPGAALEAYSRGTRLLQQEDSLAAVPHLERSVEEDRSFAPAWVRLAEGYEELGYEDKALEAARQAVELPSTGQRSRLEARALLAKLSGESVRARQLMEQLVRTYPQDAEARVTLAELYGNEGQYAKAEEILEQVVQQDPKHPRAWYQLGIFAILEGRNRAALDEYLVHALVIQNRLRNQQGQGRVLNAMGAALAGDGRPAEAAERYQEAAGLRQAIGDRGGYASSLSNLAWILSTQGDFDEAQLHLEEALTIRDEMGDRSGSADVENFMGNLAEQRGNYGNALEHYRRALQIRRLLGDRRAMAESHYNVGFAYFVLGEYDNTDVHWREARGLYEADGNLEGQAITLQGNGQLQLARGEWNQALSTLLESLEVSRTLGNREAEAVALGYLGEVARLQGRYDAAFSAFRDAREIFAEIGSRRGASEFFLHEAEAMLVIGLLGGAQKALEKAAEGLEEVADRQQKVELLRLRGELATLTAEEGSAAERLAEAQQLASSGESPLPALRVALSLGQSALAAAESPVARERAETVAARAENLGHVPLRLQALALQARAAADEDPGKAEQKVREALRLATTVSLYGESYRLHLLLADLLQRKGASKEAGEELERAGREVHRLRENLSGEAAEAFDRLPEVQAIDRRTERKTTSTA